MILASTPAEEASALENSAKVQKADFVEILDAMDGLPVTVRLLDPPLHEFLPNAWTSSSVKKATPRAALPEAGGAAELQAAEELGRGQPDDRHSRRASRRGQARSVRHAGHAL